MQAWFVTWTDGQTNYQKREQKNHKAWIEFWKIFAKIVEIFVKKETRIDKVDRTEKKHTSTKLFEIFKIKKGYQLGILGFEPFFDPLKSTMTKTSIWSTCKVFKHSLCYIE